MFEIFTEPAKQMIKEAEREAVDLGHSHLGSEHLLLGMLATGSGTAGRVLAEQSVDPVRLREECVRLLAARGITGSAQQDAADALADLGIDVEEIRRRAEENFGAGRFQYPRPVFAPEAKAVLEQSLTEMKEQGDRTVGTEHVLLALLNGDDENVGLAALRAVDVDPAGLRQAVLNQG